MKTVVVVGDTHGHLRLMFQLCRLWQLCHDQRLDAVLQCGDLGFFPYPGTVDGATRRYSRHDPEELAFSKYFESPGHLSRIRFLTAS